VRPTLEAAATVVAAWILWMVLSAVIDEKMPPPAAPGDEDEIPGSASRLDTLLPLLRNTLLIALAVVAVIVALATLGLDIGPLLAGLGVVGIAIGFGAQSLVRDVISGIFFLMEDAFRVGEYIDTGRLRGTVEGMSLRSVRLRHQNGQVHTSSVPQFAFRKKNRLFRAGTDGSNPSPSSGESPANLSFRRIEVQGRSREAAGDSRGGEHQGCAAVQQLTASPAADATESNVSLARPEPLYEFKVSGECPSIR
jgi:type IV secretory pathway VirB2 component (pilin)